MKNTLSTPTMIRVVQQGDFDAWLPRWKEYQAFYKISLDDETTKTTWSRFFDTNEPMFAAVAILNGEVVGLVHYLFHRSTWAQQDFCYLEDLFVDPQVRGRHIGKQLIEFVQGEAGRRSCARLYWHTQEANATAQKLYNWVAEKPGVIEYRMPLNTPA